MPKRRELPQDSAASSITVDPENISIDIGEAGRVSGLLQVPERASACYIFAHGAGAGMTHPFMADIASGLAARGIATLRYQFLYMERRANRPDPPKLAHAVVRAASSEAARRTKNLPLFAGGKSFGGRMTSQAQALSGLPGVQGLIFFGFPLHPAGKPSDERAAHLSDVKIPMLFLQGTSDALADVTLLNKVIGQLGPPAKLHLIDSADHSFHVPARTGRKDADVRTELLNTVATWIGATVSKTKL